MRRPAAGPRRAKPARCGSPPAARPAAGAGAAVAGLVASVVAGFYYLRIIKLMWFDPAPDGQPATDRSPVEAKTIAWACAAFAFPLVIVGLTWLQPLTSAAAVGFGAG